MLVERKLKITYLVLIFGSLLLSGKVDSRELYNRYFSVRAMGMGNAYTPVATGIESLFYNPAGLAKTKEITLTALKFRIGMNGTEAYDDAQDFDSAAFADTLRAFYGDKLWLGGGAVSGVSMPYFAAAIYDSFNISADLSNPALPSFQLDFVNDYGFATGFGLNIAPGFGIGIAAKRINRKGASSEISVASLAELSSDELEEQLDNDGLGYSLDFGTSITFPTPVKPTVSFVWKDVGDTSFQLDDGITEPPTDKSEMIGALSLEVSGMGMTFIPVFEVRHLNSDEPISFGKKVHLGFELDLPVFAIRGGLHQGYYSAGLGMDLGLISLDFATYGVELGEYPGQQEDRRYVLEMTIDFGFDPSNGSFLGTDKENRKRLKQRR